MIAAVSFDDWLVALHVLSAFAFVAGIVLFWVLIVAVRRTDTAEGTLRMNPVAKVGNAAVGIGMGGTIIFGVWLAFSVGDYDIWDPWIVAALVLWFVGAAAGRQTGEAFMAGPRKAMELREAGRLEPDAELLAINRTPNGVVLHALSSLVVLLILIDMIWKPGA
jgi:uncharacterized membrane protein